VAPSPQRPRLLVVDDEIDFADAAATYFERRGFDVAIATSGADFFTALLASRPDIVLLDLALGREDGMQLAARLREDAAIDPQPALVFLTGIATPVDRVLGLELGAEDFVEKPVSFRELLARLRAIARRRGLRATSGRMLLVGEVGVDLDAQTLVDADGGETALGPGEFALLKAFLDNPGIVLDRDRLLLLAPASDEDAADRSIDRRIARLRARLGEDAESQTVIETVRGHGYRLAATALRRLT